MDELALVQQAQAGDRAAFEEIVRRTSRLIYARICLETTDPQRAEDLVQETYLVAFRSLRQLWDPKGLRAWLVTIAQSVCIDAYRRDHRQRRAAPPRVGEAMLDGVAADEAAPDARLVHGEAVDSAMSILRSLPEEYRGPLTLRYLGGLDFESIRLQLGISAGSLRGLLNRGLTLLRSELKRTTEAGLAGGIK